MPVRQFSRGMRQRLALARTFLDQPRILLLDEPFTSLDDRAIAILSELLVEARQRGATIVLSTHQLREALAIASHVALIENGKLRYPGERTQEMLDDPGFLYRLRIAAMDGKCAPVIASPGAAGRAQRPGARDAHQRIT